MNETIRNLQTRRSVRDYSKLPVKREELEAVLDAGLSAPSAHGKRPWHIAVIEDRAILEKIAAKMPWTQATVEAPVALLVLADPSLCVQEGYWLEDCAALTANILNAARSLGLGTVWCGLSPVEANVDVVRSVLDIPKHLVPFSLIALGHPAKADAFHERVKTGDESRVTWNPDWAR